ncbi:MAG: FKBP-type peptidyl-prolyl cis-trans isomerase [Lewinellaceae bacterium]|nr:FKBP-type peptidyl-prolyl cis-trans isomerase [Lewinella sp.]MCB9278664.1 FKBP-type peptidyl-prolyl cis-trans isomerase [Lewinellaceae bacterium]
MRSALIFASLVGLVALAGLAGCGNNSKSLVTADGTEYIIHTKTGNPLPNPGDWVYFHAYIRNGEEVVNTSRKSPNVPYVQIPANVDSEKGQSVLQVLQNMGVGDSATIVVRLDTIDPKPPGFEEASVLYYDLVIQEIKTDAKFQEEVQAERAKKMEAAQAAQAQLPEIQALIKDEAAKYTSNSLGSALQTTNSGLKYIIHEEGTGKAAEPGRNLTVHYYGVLKDGSMFDNSYERGEPIDFQLGVGSVIPGWDEGFALLKEGTKATLFVPYSLAYGEAGSPPVIPERSDLIFYVELLKVN